MTVELAASYLDCDLVQNQESLFMGVFKNGLLAIWEQFPLRNHIGRCGWEGFRIWR
jgi:hypothetical protein